MAETSVVEKVTILDEPGRVHNLMPEQEQKLKAMWAQILIYSGHLSNEQASTSTALSDPALNTTKRGWFAKRDEPVTTQGVEELAETFKDSLKGMSSSDLLDTLFVMIKTDNPDNFLLRFLRARKWDVKAALVSIATSLNWRLDSRSAEILQKGDLGFIKENYEGLIMQSKSGKSWLAGHDYHGRPIIQVKPSQHKPTAQSTEAIEDFTIYVIESARLCLKAPVDTMAVLFDLSDFSLSNMDYSAVKFIIQCLERHFPESLGILFVHNSPWFFSGIWSVVKNWIDPVVASKIKFTKSSNELSEYIPLEFISKQLGGNNPSEYKFIEPDPNEDNLMNDLEKRDGLITIRNKLRKDFINQTTLWVKSTTGAESDAYKKKKIEIADDLYKNFWEVDPYIRARTIFDRNGFIELMNELHEKNWSATNF